MCSVLEVYSPVMVLRSIHFIAMWGSSVNEKAFLSHGNKEKDRLRGPCKDVLMTCISKLLKMNDKM